VVKRKGNGKVQQQPQKQAEAVPADQKKSAGFARDGPTLKYSVLVLQVSGLTHSMLEGYFARWGSVLSVMLQENHAFVTFKSAAVVTQLLSEPKKHHIATTSASAASGSEENNQRRTIIVVPRFEPSKPFWAEKERLTEAALAQLEQSAAGPSQAVAKPNNLRFREHRPKRGGPANAVLRPGQAVTHGLALFWNLQLGSAHSLIGGHLSCVAQHTWTVEFCNEGAQDRMMSSAMLLPRSQEFRIMKGHFHGTSPCGGRSSQSRVMLATLCLTHARSFFE
jgi:hypothetical protein